MENKNQVGGASSSSFTLDLFGPKDFSSSSSSSTGLFGSVFGPSSTGLGRDSAHTGSLRKQDMGSQYGNAKHGTPDNTSQRSKGEGSGIASKDRHSIYQNGTIEPCYFSSSIYYGGQEMYSPTGQTTGSQHIFKKDGGEEDDPNGNNVNSASRGNWWQGSLYY